jgi:plastocyanin
MRSKQRLAVAAFAVVLVASVSASADTFFVGMTATSFAPSTLTIKEGDTVTWLNNDEISPHTATSGNPCTSDGTFNSGGIDPGGDFSFTFTTAGDYAYFCAFHCLAGMTGSITVEQATPVGATPALATLAQNFPNPFSPSTTIEYSLRTSTRVVLGVYNTDGSLVVRLDQGVRDIGTYSVAWDGRDASGVAVRSGIYFYRLEGIQGVSPRKMVLMR